MASETSRGSTWSFMETSVLVDLWAEENTEQELSGLHRNRHVYEKLEYKMKEHGYIRTWDAIRNKIKSLRFAYLKAKQQNNTSGHSRAKMPLFNEIDAFLGTRPLTQPEISLNAGIEFVDKTAEEEDTENDIDEGGALPPEEPLEDKEIEEEHKSEKSQKAKTSPKRSRAAKKRRHDDTYGEFMKAFTEMEAAQTKMFNEQEEKRRREENRLENERTMMDRKFQLEMFKMQANLQMQMVALFKNDSTHNMQPSGDSPSSSFEQSSFGIGHALDCLMTTPTFER